MNTKLDGYGYNPTEDAAVYVARTRQLCIDLVRAKMLNEPNVNMTGNDLKANVTGCILDKFTEVDKVLFSSRQYILTLWPAFVGAIVALAPDPSRMVYDNIWWSCLFALTSGGLSGLNTASPPHHVEAYSERAGQAMCERWQYDPSKPRAMSKGETMGPLSRGACYIRLEWAAFFLSIAVWVSFCSCFGLTVQSALDFVYDKYRLPGFVWYLMSASPAICGLTLELMRDRVDLYEPVDRHQAGLHIISSSADERRTSSLASEQSFRHIRLKSVFSLWLRILQHQWRRSRYRLLVHDQRSCKTELIFAFGRGIVTMGRLIIFAMGSISMGNIVLMSVPDDLYLFALLLFTTSIPRQLWPAFWMNGNRGADLVVWVRRVKMTGLD